MVAQFLNFNIREAESGKIPEFKGYLVYIKRLSLYENKKIKQISKRVINLKVTKHSSS